MVGRAVAVEVSRTWRDNMTWSLTATRALTTAVVVTDEEVEEK
jgi:hypothetical protein